MATFQTTAPLVHTTLSASYRRAAELARLVADGDIDLDPSYQRARAWSVEQEMALVRSWLTGIPTGTVILSDRATRSWRNADGVSPLDTATAATWACVDGKQRITTAGRWFTGQFAVPASWFAPEFVETTHDTPDGKYIAFPGLTVVGRRMVESRAMLQVAEARTTHNVVEEAQIYLLVNGGGTPQTAEDMNKAAQVARGTGSEGD